MSEAEAVCPACGHANGHQAQNSPYERNESCEATLYGCARDTYLTALIDTLRERLRWRDAGKGELPDDGALVLRYDEEEGRAVAATFSLSHDGAHVWRNSAVRWLPLPEVNS